MFPANKKAIPAYTKSTSSVRCSGTLMMPVILPSFLRSCITLSISSFTYHTRYMSGLMMSYPSEKGDLLLVVSLFHETTYLYIKKEVDALKRHLLLIVKHNTYLICYFF